MVPTTKGGLTAMGVREGLIPTILGTAVTTAGLAMRGYGMRPMVANSVIGFGLAHVVLGAIDLVEHR